MELIENKEDLLKNVQTMDAYLASDQDSEKGFTFELLRKGVCFVAIPYEQGYRFYPSRFIGYKDNNMEQYLANELKAGKEANPVLCDLLGSKPSQNAELEKEYRNFCKKVGLTPRNRGAFGVERKYWLWPQK